MSETGAVVVAPGAGAEAALRGKGVGASGEEAEVAAPAIRVRSAVTRKGPGVTLEGQQVALTGAPGEVIYQAVSERGAEGTVVGKFPGNDQGNVCSARRGVCEGRIR